MPKGHTNNPHGRPKGIPNKNSLSVKAAFQAAFEGLGGVPALIEWAEDKNNRGEFYKLYSKLLPKDVEVTGADGGPIQTAIRVSFVGTDAERIG